MPRRKIPPDLISCDQRTPWLLFWMLYVAIATFIIVVLIKEFRS